MRLLFVAIIILGVILAYGKPNTWLFWIALVNMITYLIVSLTIPNIIAFKAMKRHKTKVEAAYQEGATEEEINLILEEEVIITTIDEKSVPIWLILVGFINVAISVIILISSILIRLT